jgi:hypothetical protein
MCAQGYRDLALPGQEDEEDGEAPEDDPDVQDIRWF